MHGGRGKMVRCDKPVLIDIIYPCLSDPCQYMPGPCTPARPRQPDGRFEDSRYVGTYLGTYLGTLNMVLYLQEQSLCRLLKIYLRHLSIRNLLRL